MYCSVKGCINNMNGYCDSLNYISIDENGQCEDMIVRGNSVKQEIHGVWLDCGNKIECSVCGKKVFLGTFDQGIHDEEKALLKFCSNCGTPMNVGGESDAQ